MSQTLAGFLNNSVAGLNSSAAGSTGKPQAPEELVEAAQAFESVFLAQFLETITKDMQGGAFGSGSENPLTDMIKTEYAAMISKSGGIGVGDAVLREMLKMQEAG